MSTDYQTLLNRVERALRFAQQTEPRLTKDKHAMVIRGKKFPADTIVKIIRIGTYLNKFNGREEVRVLCKPPTGREEWVSAYNLQPVVSAQEIATHVAAVRNHQQAVAEAAAKSNAPTQPQNDIDPGNQAEADLANREMNEDIFAAQRAALRHEIPTHVLVREMTRANLIAEGEDGSEADRIYEDQGIEMC